MKCFLCTLKINPSKMDFSFMFDGEEVSYAHLVCIKYQETMERIETEEYLAKELAW